VVFAGLVGCSEGVTGPTGGVALLTESAAHGQSRVVPSTSADVTCTGAAESSLFPAPFLTTEKVTLSTAGCTSLNVSGLRWNFDVLGLARTVDNTVDTITVANDDPASPYLIDNGGDVEVTRVSKGSYADIGSTEAGSTLLLSGSSGPAAVEVQLQFWRFTAGTMSGSVTATNLRGNPAACAVKASLSDLERNTAYYLYYNYDERAPTLIASGQSTKRGTLSVSGQLSKAEFDTKELGRFFVTSQPLYTGLGPFSGSSRMLLFSGKLTASRCT